MSISRNLSIFADTVATSGNAVSSVTIPVLNGSTTLALQTGSTGAMYIDASQNVGVGNTSPSYKLDVTGTARATTSVISPIVNGATTLSLQTGGTTAAYFDASQNVGIGNTSPAYKLDVTGTVRATTSVISPIVNGATTLSLQTGGTTGLYLDPSGNVAIGTTSPAAKLNVNGNQLNYGTNPFIALSNVNNNTPSYIQYLTSANALQLVCAGGANTGYILFLTGTGNEAARMDASGNLLVGTTSSPNGGVKFASVMSNSNYAGWFQNTNASPYGISIYYSGASPNNGTNSFIYANDSTTARFYVTSNGGIGNYQANNTNLSDERLKKDIQLAGPYLDKICAIPVKTFLYKDQTDNEFNLGVIAQDVLAAAPELVDKDGWQQKSEDGTTYLSIYQTDLQYALMKCIQELSAEVTALKAKVGA